MFIAISQRCKERVHKDGGFLRSIKDESNHPPGIVIRPHTRLADTAGSGLTNEMIGGEELPRNEEA